VRTSALTRTSCPAASSRAMNVRKSLVAMYSPH
jgi:hypothetical protein